MATRLEMEIRRSLSFTTNRHSSDILGPDNVSICNITHPIMQPSRLYISQELSDDVVGLINCYLILRTCALVYVESESDPPFSLNYHLP